MEHSLNVTHKSYRFLFSEVSENSKQRAGKVRTLQKFVFQRCSLKCVSTVKHYMNRSLSWMVDTMMKDVLYFPNFTVQLFLRYLFCTAPADDIIHVSCIFLMKIMVFLQAKGLLLCHSKVVRQIDFFGLKGQLQTIFPILKYR